ncbi:hypothetical protein X797_010685 [Metarhizium robertsii]|uniref:Uncharacterized protein n=1 Tax=Metarhizium robertsii TaxID=568076 RepID=A0A014N8D1_9HYPO|nr:hypothetical protein X797_010685 [Metarhizium robertsii]
MASGFLVNNTPRKMTADIGLWNKLTPGHVCGLVSFAGGRTVELGFSINRMAGKRQEFVSIHVGTELSSRY